MSQNSFPDVPLLTVGDRVPDFQLPDQRGMVSPFYERTRGRPVALCLMPEFILPFIPAALAGLKADQETLEAAEIDVFGISPSPAATVKGAKPAIHLWADETGQISQTLRERLGDQISPPAPDDAVVLMLDANQRLLACKTLPGNRISGEILAFYRTRPAPERARVINAAAPVLLIPQVLDSGICAALIDLWTTAGNEEATVGAVMEGEEVCVMRPHIKKRRDHAITDRNRHIYLSQLIGRRIGPEVEKAFGFSGFRFDRFLVVCYNADREDRFRPHRDNISPGTQDRQFAMTLNLNASEYEGGELVFPEYGPDKYKAGDGGAVIFSCSLIHEALPVTKGNRFALLTFLRKTA